MKKKYSFNFGTNIGYTNFTQTDLKNNIDSKRDFVNWFPQANFSYAFTSQRRVSVYYNGSTSQPSLQQIQPVRTNDDPLNITIGNPALRPSFRNNINLNEFNYLLGATFLLIACQMVLIFTGNHSEQ